MTMSAGGAQRPAATAFPAAGRVVGLALVGLCLPALGCGAGDVAVDPSNPLHGQELYVDPTSPAANQVRQWEDAGREADAEALRRIADQPKALWVTGDPAAVEQEVRARMQAAAEAETTPVLVAYNIPGRDCGSYSAGGAPDAATYRTWVTNLARGLGDDRAVVILEPDALSHAIAGCISAAQAQERYALLRETVTTLASSPATIVYLDAGNSSWITDTTMVATALRQAGGQEAAGFALNVANFNSTDATVAYGRALADAVGGARFVIDTSRNGRGPHPDPEVDGAPNWCNPPGRALGHPPTTQTGLPGVDAFLCLKPPGASDGCCRPGEPAAGQWWLDYALELARAAATR